MQCPNCNFSLSSQKCPDCGKKNVLEAKFCNWCGNEFDSVLASKAVASEEADEAVKRGERLACSDGMCIGIIGEDGLCVVCNRAYSGPPSLEDEASEKVELDEKKPENNDKDPKEPEAE